jgi:hypothetical protein
MKICKHCGVTYVYMQRVHRTGTASPLYCSKECRVEVRKEINANNKASAKRRLEEGEELHYILNHRLSVIRSSAIARGYDFELTRDNVMPYYKVACHYCGDPVRNINLDRIDNSGGYVIGNVVSCCLNCNLMKRSQNQGAFIANCKRIAAMH